MKRSNFGIGDLLVSKKMLTLSIMMLFSHVYLHAQTTIKPVNGTWVNLPYQDVRNKYMNPAHVDNTNPEFWKTKVRELREMGLTYVVIMAVANERKSFYPSSFMEPAYPVGQESPVEAIMNEAEKQGMHVFMSCGWAIDQDDDIRSPEIKAIQQQIMAETATLFGDRKSFYGWYLPVEDSMEPILPDHSVEAVNALTAAAKALTPHAQVMISPYGVCYASLSDPNFARQIKKLNVDIIAYQDEVGCVREPLPMPRMKENFKLLGEIHRGTGIRFWSNVESFTWEREDNSRESALIPAAFPRYLSQIVGATLAGAEEVISFSVYGIMDKLGSEMPIGQPIGSAASYKDYMDWRAGNGRWPLLEYTFRGESMKHDALGKPVHYNTHPSTPYDKGNLTDAALGQESFHDGRWVGFEHGKMDVVIDLKRKQTVHSIAARFLHYRPEGISLPQMVDFYVSADGKQYEKIETVVLNAFGNDLHDCWIDLGLAKDLSVQARYIRVVATEKANNLIFCDEIMVNPVY